MIKNARRPAASFTALALGLGGLLTFAAATPAAAADVDVIDPGSLTLTTANGTDGNLDRYDSARLAMDWSDNGQQLHEGDTFSVQLPPELAAATGSFTIDADENGSPVPAGQCQVTPASGSAPASVLCTFTDYVNGKQDVSGSLWLQVDAAQQTSSENVVVTVDGKPVVVDLPGTGGIAPQDSGRLPVEPAKHGWWTSPARDTIQWVVDVPGSQVDPDGGITLSDTLGGGQSLVQSGSGAPIVRTIGASQEAWNTQQWSDLSADRWRVTASDDSSLSMKVDGPIDSQLVYRFAYQSRLTDAAGTTVGDIFDNSADAAGTTVTSRVVYRSSGGGDASGTGTGAFNVAKLPIEGDGASAVPADTSFSVKASYVDAQGTAQDTTLELTAGGEAAGLDGLPVGTVVSLSEVDLPKLDGVRWSEPEFTAKPNENIAVADDGQSAKVTIVSGATLKVELRNVAAAVPPAPTPTPTPTPSEKTPTPSPAPSSPAPTPSESASPTPAPSHTPAAATPTGKALAATGAEVSPIVGVAAAGALLIGGALMLLRRRGTRSER